MKEISLDTYNEMIDYCNRIGENVERENMIQKIINNSKENDNMEAYQVRMLKEYQELKERYNKLHKMLVKYDAGTLNFTPTCPIELLRKQKSLMGQYLNVLEIRAEIEKIDLDYTVKEDN